MIVGAYTNDVWADIVSVLGNIIYVSGYNGIVSPAINDASSYIAFGLT